MIRIRPHTGENIKVVRSRPKSRFVLDIRPRRASAKREFNLAVLEPISPAGPNRSIVKKKHKILGYRYCILGISLRRYIRKSRRHNAGSTGRLESRVQGSRNVVSRFFVYLGEKASR